MPWKAEPCSETLDERTKKAMNKSHGASTRPQRRHSRRQSCLDCGVAILAGGLGTRLAPILTTTPKVLAPVNGRPFLTILLDVLAGAGIRSAVLLTGHQADQVRWTLGDHYAGMALAYSVEATPLGTGGALRRALPLFSSDTVLVLNGDSYFEVDLHALVQAHHRNRADITLTLARVDDAGRFGQVKTAADGRVIQFVEKDEASSAEWINAGVYVLQRSLLRQIPPGQPISLERELLPHWTGSRRVFGFAGAGRFLDIGTPSSYAAAPEFFESGGRSRHAAP